MIIPESIITYGRHCKKCGSYDLTQINTETKTGERFVYLNMDCEHEWTEEEDED